MVWLADPMPLLKCRVLPTFQIKLYRTQGLNPRVRPKGRATASPPCGVMDHDSMGKPHRLCARLKRRDLHYITPYHFREFPKGRNPTNYSSSHLTLAISRQLSRADETADGPP